MNAHEIVSSSPAETQALGEAWGREAQPGWIVGLTGDLGAGKTQLVKGLARGLGVTEKVQSPTFALINVYAGARLPLAHLDLYRLESLQQILGAGLEGYLHWPEGVAVVEWVERWLQEREPRDVYPPGGGTRFRLVRIQETGENTRRITYEDFGT